MRIHRSKPAGNFVVIPNETMRDPRLTLRARGLLAEMLTRPDDWSVTIRRLAELEREGYESVRLAAAELDRAGYLIRTRQRGPRGRFRTEVDLFDVPHCLTEDGTFVPLQQQEQQHEVAQDDVSAGHTGTRNTGPRSAGPRSTGVRSTGNTVDQGPAGRGSLRRPTTKTDTKTDDQDQALSLGPLLQQQLPEATAGEREQVAREIVRASKPHSPRAYLRKIPAADAAAVLAELRRSSSGPAARWLRAWCGKCDGPDSRWRELDDGTVMRCPDCGELAQ